MPVEIPDRPSRSEVLWLAFVTAVLFVLDVVSLDYFPAVWIDDVSFSEPAINFVQQGAFTTTVWQFQPPNTFPVVNCPAYSLALGVWLKVLGTTLLDVRCFNYFLMSVAGVLLWAFMRRHALPPTAWQRLVVVILTHLGFGISFSYRSSRPDVLGMVFLLAMALVLGIQRHRWRELALFVIGAGTVWIGLQIALCAWLAVFVCWWFLKQTGFRDITALTLGVGTGAASLFSFLWSKEMLGHFLVSISSVVGKHHMHTSDLGVLASLKNVCVASVASYWNDFSALPLFFLLLVLLLVVKAQSIHGMRRLGWITIGWFFGLPVVFNIVGHYAFYYSYMRFLPLALVCVSVAGSIAANAGTVWRRWVRLAVGVAACTSLCVGLPLRIAVTKHFFNLEPRGKIQHTLEQHLLKNDVVFCDYLAFFGVKNICSRVYVPNSSMDLVPYKVPGNRFSEAEKQAVSVLVVRTDRVAVYTNYFPATWTVMAGPFGDSLNRAALDRVPLFRRRLAHHLAQPQVERQPLLILRRAPRAE